MKWLNCSRIRLKLFVFVAAIVIGSGSANADFIWGTPTNLGPVVNSSAVDGNQSISADGLSLFFESDRPGGYGGRDIWVTTRETIQDPWGEPVNLGPTVNSTHKEWSQSISADGLSLYLSSDRPGGYGELDLWVTTRATTEDDWGTPVNLGPTVNSSSYDWSPSISPDGFTLYFASIRPDGLGKWDIYVTRRATKDDDWSAPVNLGPTVNSSALDSGPSISADGLSLFFFSKRPGGYGGTFGDIWVTTRATIDDDWGTPVNLGPTVNSSNSETSPAISADGRTLFFMSDQPGGVGNSDIWQVSITPVVDFNGDGIVDVQDIVILTRYWGTSYSLCDIGPTPLGDGIVDVRDLLVLAEYIEPEVRESGLIAHWKLDESERNTAQDSVSGDNAILIGDPLWQPDGGMVAGALQFDGVDDCVSVEFVLNPAVGPFSVFAWIKGGAPGQVVVSQADGADWLLADPSEGKLRTSLLRPGGGRTAPQPLISEFIITDGNWHRVGFVWDGSNRTLYVDGVAVAEDLQDSLEGSINGLYIGTGKNLEPGSFFSGLIDDVRIYNRAIIP